MYKTIFAYWKEEKIKEEITKLPRDIYEKALMYIEENKKKILENTDELLARIIPIENNVILSLLNDLFKLRIKKIVLLQTNNKNIPVEELTNLELKFLTSSIQKFGLFVNNLKQLYESGFSNVNKQDIQREEKILKEKTKDSTKNLERLNQKEHTHLLIKINKDLPELTGADLKIYGPFKKGDIVHIPKINAKILLEKRVAEKIKLH